MKYQYRTTSSLDGSSLQPQTFTHTLGAAVEAAQGHANELPGCVTKIEEKDGKGWKLWHAGNWEGKMNAITGEFDYTQK